MSLFFLISAILAEAQNNDTTYRPKLFGGLDQYRKFTIGINGGVTAPSVATGGTNDFTHNQVKVGYGLSMEEQLSHSFGLQLDLHGGNVQGNNSSGLGPNPVDYSASSFETRFWSATLSGVANVGSISFNHRNNGVNFFVTGGGGIDLYSPKVIYKDGTVVNWRGHAGEIDGTGYNEFVKDFVIPVGVGAKFKVTDVTAITLGYTENFVDDDIFDGVKRGYPSNDKYSYGYAGLEFTLGSSKKRNIEWVNPIAVMYDELYDQQLRDDVRSLHKRVSNVECKIDSLKKDSDNDGVSDQFDKCPGTPTGIAVDGSGCPIKFPKDTIMIDNIDTSKFSNIQFRFDSSILETSSYVTLDSTSQDLKSSNDIIELDGYASSEGTYEHNIKLSLDRALSVKAYLVNSGVNSNRINIKGYGETNPIADNSTEYGRSKNRRVEFKIK
jgi:OOP family OmpA-OmpF porin